MVANPNFDIASDPVRRYFGRTPVFQRIVDKVGEAALQRAWPRFDIASARPHKRHGQSRHGRIIHDDLEQLIEREANERLLRLHAAGIVQPFADQRLHRAQIIDQAAAERRILHFLEPEAQARHRRLQVVGDRCQQLGAFHDIGSQRRLHRVECPGGLANLAGPQFRKRVTLEILPQRPGGARQVAKRGRRHARGEKGERGEAGREDQHERRVHPIGFTLHMPAHLELQQSATRQGRRDNPTVELIENGGGGQAGEA